MARLKPFVNIVGVTALCLVIWLVHPAKEQVEQLEKDIGSQYFSANTLLHNTVDKLSKWNFKEPITESDKDYLNHLSNEFYYTTDLLLSNRNVHPEWRDRVYDIDRNLRNYSYDSSLSKEDIDDLKQGLLAFKFITMDLQHTIKDGHDFYRAMHDEKHEMVERVKERLAMKY